MTGMRSAKRKRRGARAGPSGRSGSGRRRRRPPHDLTHLQQTVGNAAVTRLVHATRIARDEDDTSLTPLQQHIRELARRHEPERTEMPPDLSGAAAFTVGPLGSNEAARLLSLTGTSPEEAQRRALALDPEMQAPPLRSVELVYTNDGTGIFPNFGGGSDHGLTAGAAVRFHYENDELGLVEAGHNLEIWTPQKGGEAIGGEYPGGPGGYKGLYFVDFDYRIAQSGQTSVHLLTELGTNSEFLGELVQSRIVHEPLGIPLFQWGDKPAEFYGSGGARVATIQDLVDQEGFVGGNLRVRLLLDAEAMAGTHESSAGAGARLQLRAGRLGVDGLRGSLRLSVGAEGSVVGRYRDRGGNRAGLEGTVTNEVGLSLDEVGEVLGPGGVVPGSIGVSLGGRSTRGTLPSSQAGPDEDQPATSGAWAGPGSRSEGIVKVTYGFTF